MSEQGYQINEETRDKKVRPVSDTGEQLGIMSARKALERATDVNLDLVKISPTVNPPVCKLMDYSRYRSKQTKREREARENQRVVEVKGVHMSPSIDVSDSNVELRNVQRFPTEGNQVKVAARFRGREMAHANIGKGLLFKLVEQRGEVATSGEDPKLGGRHVSIFLSPKVAKGAKKP